MATPIKETPVLNGNNAEIFLTKLVSDKKAISTNELSIRKDNYNRLEKMRKFQ